MAKMNFLPAVTAENYFDPDIEMAYMGSTQVKNFMRCEAAELARLKGEYQPAVNTAMLVGSYVDAHFEGSLPVFQAQHPELFKRDGTLKAEFSRANDIISRMEEDELYSLLMSGRKQVICTGEIAGVPFKVKIDSLLDGNTCTEIVRRFPETAPVMGLCDGPFGEPGGTTFRVPSTRPLRGICGRSCWLLGPRKMRRTCRRSISGTKSSRLSWRRLRMQSPASRLSKRA